MRTETEPPAALPWSATQRLPDCMRCGAGFPFSAAEGGCKALSWRFSCWRQPEPLRFDLNETQLWVLGMRWSLGIDAFLRGEATAVQTGWAILWRGFLPALGLIAIFLGIAYRYGRLYCGWLCPPFRWWKL